MGRPTNILTRYKSFSDLPENIQDKIMPEPNSGCWIWIGAKRDCGYGNLSVKGKNKQAHRVIFSIMTGIEPEDKLLCHTCDNPPCVNPEHMFLGTMKDNMLDMISKNRYPDRKGENNPFSKLTTEDVIQIRNFSSQGMDEKEISKQLGFHQATISNVIGGITWKHI